MARSTVWWTCCFVAGAIAAGSAARARFDRQSPRSNAANENVRAINRSPVASNDRRETRYLFYTSHVWHAIVSGTKLALLLANGVDAVRRFIDLRFGRVYRGFRFRVASRP